MTNYVNQHMKEIRKNLLLAYGNKCCVCGSTENLEFAHRNKTKLSGSGRGRKERYYDVIKNPLDYGLTCKKHNSVIEGK
jgi:hypothetical protein